MTSDDEIAPDVQRDGVPLCSESCPKHDGKRCRLLGFRPDRICEPAVVRLVNLAERLRSSIVLVNDAAYHDRDDGRYGEFKSKQNALLDEAKRLLKP